MKNREILGVILALVGLLFLLLSNGLLWFGWGAVWPLFFLLAGGFLLRIFPDTKIPEQLFGGLVLLFLGFFLLVFTTGILPWSDLSRLWPTFPMIIGISLLAMAGMKRHATGSFVSGISAVIISIACYTYTADVISHRVAAPFVRLWPLVLILSGVYVFMRARRENAEHGAVPALPFDDGDEPPQARATGIEDALAGAGDPDQVVRAAVAWLKDTYVNYSWVGVYRREEDMLVLDPNHYRGVDPEHTRIRIPEGICGQAVQMRHTIIVPDVREDGRYLACSPFTRSEIVVPIIKGGDVYGVLDIDSNDLDAFKDEDRRRLEHVAALMSTRL